SSISRLQIMMPPKGACLSVANAFSQAWRRSESLPTPHGLVCFKIATVASSKSQIKLVAALMSRMLLNDRSLPCSFSKCRLKSPMHPRYRYFRSRLQESHQVAQLPARRDRD